MQKEKIIMGIDGSITSTGVSILNGDNGEIIAYDNIPIKSKDFKSDEMLKIHHISSIITELAKAYNVTHIAIEDSYIGGGKKVGITLARLYGGITTMLIENGFTLIYTYTANQWRKISMNVGNKSKEGTFKWVCENVVDLGEFKSSGVGKNEDISDSIGIAYALYKKLNKL